MISFSYSHFCLCGCKHVFNLKQFLSYFLMVMVVMSVKSYVQAQPSARGWGDRFPLEFNRDFFISKNKNGELVFKFRKEILDGLDRVNVVFVLENYNNDCYLSVTKQVKQTKQFSVITLSRDLTEALFKHRKMNGVWLVNEFNKYSLYVFLNVI